MSCVTWLPKSMIRTVSVMPASLSPQRGDEEAVGGGAVRRKHDTAGAKERRLGEARSDVRRRDDLGRRHDGEFGMRHEEGGDLVLVLLGKQRAGDIDQPTVRTHEARG